MWGSTPLQQIPIDVGWITVRPLAHRSIGLATLFPSTGDICAHIKTVPNYSSNLFETSRRLCDRVSVTLALHFDDDLLISLGALAYRAVGSGCPSTLECTVFQRLTASSLFTQPLGMLLVLPLYFLFPPLLRSHAPKGLVVCKHHWCIGALCGRTWQYACTYHASWKPKQ